jgi:spore germination protein GerM
MEELLAGPSAAEQETWPLLATAIPEGTDLLGLTISDGVAKVDLSSEFESGGGTWSVTARLAQVVYTLAQFDTVDAVEFSIDGEVVELFSGEGLVLDGPQSPEDYEQLVPVDA